MKKRPRVSDSKLISDLKRQSFKYFLEASKHRLGLMPDCNRPGSPCSVAVVGIGLCVFLVGVEEGYISRKEALRRTLRTLRFFWNSPQGKEKDATGYQGFYYHFLDMKTGKRTWKCELSTIDTAIFIAGALTAAEYFDKDSPAEIEVRKLAQDLYLRINWKWALNRKKTISHGWTPEKGFLKPHWAGGYSEAHILYILALGSPTFPISPECYEAWTAEFKVRTFYRRKYVYAGPLFIHQLSQIWLDLRGQRDKLNRRLGFDYFENSRRATEVHRQYCIENPHNFKHYGKDTWGITASDGPGPARLTVNGKDVVFYGYKERGAPADIDDGTLSPWAVTASLPFSPAITLKATRHTIEWLKLNDTVRGAGFDASYNRTFPSDKSGKGWWVSPWRFGLNQGPVILMIENYQTKNIWKHFKKCSFANEGLKRAGFEPFRRKRS